MGAVLMEKQIRPVQGQVAVDLVGRNLVKPLPPYFRRRPSKPGCPECWSLGKCPGPDGGVHMAFRREIDHHIRLFPLKQPVHNRRVRDIRPDKGKRGFFMASASVSTFPRMVRRSTQKNVIVRMRFRHIVEQSWSR